MILRLRVVPVVPDQQISLNPGPQKRRVIAAPGVGALGLDAQRLGHRFELLPQLTPAVNQQPVTAGPDHVELNLGHGVFQRIARVLDVVAGSPQPLFLTVPSGEQHGAPGHVALLVPTASHLQQNCHSRSIVVGSPPDRAVRRLPKVIVVAADDDDLVGVFRIATGKHAQHVSSLASLAGASFRPRGRHFHPSLSGQGEGREAG